MDLDALLAEQHGVLTASQSATVGVSSARLRHLLATDRWQRVLPRVVAATPGELPQPARLRAALLYTGEDAALSHDTGLAIWGVDGPASDVVHVTIPHDRRVRSVGFVDVHRCRHWTDADVLVRQSLPVLRLERCLVGACTMLRDRDAVRDLVAKTVQSRRTTLPRIDSALGTGAGTALVRDVLEAVASGEHSALERELAAVLTRFGLPKPRRQHPVRTVDGALRILDFAYDDVMLGLEAEGAEWHLSPAAWAADLARQNALIATGWTLLRFPTSEIRRHPERVAALIATELRRRGRTW